MPFLRYPAGMGSSGNDQTNAIVAAPNGDTLFAGSFSGPTFNLGVKGSSPFTVTNAAPGGGTTDAWLGKWLASSQSATWIARFGNAAGNEAVNDMVADSSSNIFFAGTFSTVNSQNQLYTQALVGRLSSTGATTWVVRFGNGGNNEAMGVTLSPAQDFIYVTGSYDTGITFGSTTYTSTGGSNVFVVKMSASTGAIQWGIQFSGTSMDRAYSIVTDLSSKVEQGSVLIAGYTTSPAFGAGSFRLNTNGGEEGWIARVSPTGTITWAAVVGGTGNDRPTMGLAVSSSTGNIYVSGSISSSSVLFGANTVTKAGAGSAISVAKFAPSGTPMWLKVFSGDGNDECSSLALNMASETIYVGATKGSSSLTFNGATVTSRLIVFSLDSNGNAITAGQITGASTSRTQNVVRTTYLDLQGRVWIGGSFDSADTVSLNGAPFAEFGAQDAFVGLFSSNLQPLVS